MGENNQKELSIEQLKKELAKLKEENRYLSENINNKEIEISELKEAHEKELKEKLDAKEKQLKADMDLNQKNFDNINNMQTMYIRRRESELDEMVNVANHMVNCVESFAYLCKFASNKVIERITKEN